MNEDQIIQTLVADGYSLQEAIIYTNDFTGNYIKTLTHATKPEVKLFTVNGYCHIYKEVTVDQV